MALNRYRGRDMPTAQVKQHVEPALHGRNPLSYSGHVKQRMKQREFDSQDIQHVLETGNYSKGYWDAQHQNHEFNVTGYDLNGEELELSCALCESPPCITVVTGKREKYEPKMPRQETKEGKGDT